MLIRYSIRFLLRPKPAADGRVSLRMRVHIFGVGSVDFETGIAVDPSDWDKDARRARTDETANRAIDEYTAVVKEVFNRYEYIEKRTPTQAEFKASKSNSTDTRRRSSTSITASVFAAIWRYR